MIDNATRYAAIRAELNHADDVVYLNPDDWEAMKTVARATSGSFLSTPHQHLNTNPLPTETADAPQPSLDSPSVGLVENHTIKTDPLVDPDTFVIQPANQQRPRRYIFPKDAA